MCAPGFATVAADPAMGGSESAHHDSPTATLTATAVSRPAPTTSATFSAPRSLLVAGERDGSIAFTSQSLCTPNPGGMACGGSLGPSAPACYLYNVMSVPPETPQATPTDHRSGFVAIIGRPNVGKSTLLNQLLGQKVAIVTPKPQTTRSRILGIKTLPQAQIIFIDTPGLHQPRNLINRRMVQVAERAVEEADILLWVVDAIDGITPADREVAAHVHAASQAGRGRPLAAVLNKIDRRARNDLLPLLAALQALVPGCDIIPVSARTGANLEELVSYLSRTLPLGPCYYDTDALTDQTERMLAQEAVREQVLLQTRDEIPYAIAVTVDKFEDKGDLAVITATIHVERASQKGIVIGQRGARIKAIGIGARRELERLLGRRVYLELFVRVQEEWTKRESLLKEFGL